MLTSEKTSFISEDELIEKIRLRETYALNYLYDKYSAALYGVILKVVVHEEFAEEVLQDAFIKIWDKIRDYDKQKGRLFTWMLNISRNLAIDKLRSKEYSQLNKTSYGFVNVSISDESSPNGIEDGIGMDAVLSKLPEDQRNLIELMYFKGYSQSEIADNLEMPLGTIKTKVRSAMSKLRDLLK